jgi:phage shock protein A
MQDESLESQFAELEYDSDVEAELDALKASMGKAPEPLGTGDHLESSSPT